jgi:serine/threonine protein kinase
MRLRGDSLGLQPGLSRVGVVAPSDSYQNGALVGTQRFSADFIATAPQNAQKFILLCIERDPSKRPTAVELLAVSIVVYFKVFEHRTLIFAPFDCRASSYLGKLKSNRIISRKPCSC